jgi:hypothetical protein
MQSKYLKVLHTVLYLGLFGGGEGQNCAYYIILKTQYLRFDLRLSMYYITRLRDL